VIAAASLIALTASNLQRSYPGLIEAGGLIGTLVSVIFLFAIALINLVVLIGAFRVFRLAKRGEDYAAEELDVFLAQRGLLSRVPNPVRIDFPQLAYVSAGIFVRARL
jgi:high-affinity nickel-transport protein